MDRTAMADPPRRLPPKKEVAIALLEGPSVFVHLDPRRPGVVVPKWFMGQPQLVLQLGLNMAIPIPDLKVDEDGMTCTLSFNRAPFWCFLPWTAVYALVGEDGRGMIWPNDVPAEVSQQMQKTPAGAPKRRSRAKLTAVSERPPAPSATDRSTGDTPSAPSDPSPKRRGRPEAPVPQPQPAAAKSSFDAPERSDRGLRRLESAPPPAAPSPQEQPIVPAAAKKRRELPPYLRVVK